MRHRLILIVIISLMVLLIGTLIWRELDDLENMTRYVTSLRTMGAQGCALLAVGYALVALFPVPLMPLTALGGYVLGFWWGLACLWPAAVISACLSHYAGQRFLVEAVPSILQRFPKAEFLCGQAVQSDWVTVAVNRLLPVCPFAIQNVVLGAIGLPLRAQFFGTVVGILPALCFALYCGSIAQALTQVLTEPAEMMPKGRLFMLFVSLLVGLAVLVWIRRRLAGHQSNSG